MRIIFLIAFLLTNVAVSITLGELIGYANDPAFAPYEKLFKEEADKHEITGLKHCKIYFGTTNDSGDIAEGYSGSSLSRPFVIVDEKYWNTLDNTGKEILIFHELGHALLHEAHASGVMEHKLLNNQFYLDNREALLNQFFKAAQP